MFSPAYKRYALVAMTAVYTLNLVDRGLVALLLQPIKEDLDLSDTQLGLLTGIAFGLFYAILGVPIARWADRGNRVTIASLSIGLWGITVMACMFVTSFVQLLLARMAAAVGESGCKPPTYSLVGDYFPGPAERTRAMAIYMTANSLSTLVSFILGGWLNDLYGWRVTFLIMGIPGIVLAVIVKLTIAEPRTHTRAALAAAPPAPSMKVVMRTLWHLQSCRHLGFALILLYTMSLGLWPWFAAFMVRSHGMETSELGLWMGLILSLGGIAGTVLGGYVSSRWYTGREASQMRLSALTIAFVLPCFIGFLTFPHKHLALLALIPLIMSIAFYMAPTYVLLQRLVRDDVRATMMAVIMLLTNLIGFGIGPQIVGILSDLLMPVAGSDSLRYAMLIMSFTALWAGYHFWRVGGTVKQDLLRVATEPVR